jgi:hypothetical protein
MTVRIGLDRGDASVERLEHDLLQALDAVGLDPAYICTHQVRDDRPHWAASLELAAQPGDSLSTVDLLTRLGEALAAPPHDDDLHRLAFADPHAPGAPGPDRPSLAAVGEPDGVEVILGAEAWRGSARDAALDLRAGRAGRACVFPGQALLPAELTFAELRAATPIRELLAVGTTVADDTVLITHGHLRPSLMDGVLVLAVVPAALGQVRPFELPVPRQCCETPDQYAARQAVYDHVHGRVPA